MLARCMLGSCVRLSVKPSLKGRAHGHVTYFTARRYEEKLPKISTGWVGRTNVTDDRQPTIFLRRLVPWPSIDIQGKFIGDRPRGTPSSGDLNTRRVARYSDSHLWNAVSPKRCKIGGKFVLITNTKSYMSFWLVPKSVTLNDLERQNGPYFALFLSGRIA